MRATAISPVSGRPDGTIQSLIWGVAVLVPASWLLAADAHAQPFRKGPYLQKVSRSSVTVMWESDPPCRGSVTLPDETPARTITVEYDDEEMSEVLVDNLEPGRRYRYIVECGDKRVESEFATASAAGEPFTFVVLGDTRSNAGSHRRVIQRIRREVPDFILATGDMVDDGSRERQWQEFFEIERDLLKENVLFPSLGNHDRQGRGKTANNFRKFFALPENSPDPERYYAFTYGSARFLILDSNAYSFSLTDQTAWIEQQLQAAELDPDIQHVFVSMHHPPFSISLHGGQRELRERWTPLFEQYNVTAVFSGHDHVYSRAENGGVHYYVTGGGGAPLYPRGRRTTKIDRQATRYFERVNHYLRVHVIGELVEVSAIRADGTLIETVSWGTLPRANPDRQQPAIGAGAEPPAADAVAEAPAPMPVIQPQEPRSPRPAVRPASGDDGYRFGFMSQLGAALVLIAGSILIWSLRS